MTETELEQKERERREDLAKLRGLRPIDDEFMRCIFRDNIPLAQFVRRTRKEWRSCAVRLKRREKKE